jgi:hypothetical protein
MCSMEQVTLVHLKKNTDDIAPFPTMLKRLYKSSLDAPIGL